MVTQYENLFFDDFCDTMWSALDVIGYKGDVGFVNEVMNIMNECLVKKTDRGVGVFVRRGADGSVRISVIGDEKPICENFESGSALILYARLSISRYGIIDMKVYEDIEIWS